MEDGNLNDKIIEGEPVYPNQSIYLNPSKFVLKWVMAMLFYVWGDGYQTYQTKLNFNQGRATW